MVIKVRILKIEDGACCHLEKSKIHNNSAVD